VHFQNKNIFFYCEKMLWLTMVYASVVVVNAAVVVVNAAVLGSCVTSQPSP
jgi:type III secretory pathway component EscS